jgi:hypothetical protein
MQKNALLCWMLLFVFLSLSSHAQRRGDSYVKITNSYLIKRFDLDSIQSILFVFEGDGEIFVSKYLDLAERLKRRWKRRAKVGFRYNLKYKNEEMAEFIDLPQDKNSQIVHDFQCKIRSYHFRKKIYHGIYRYSYLMNIELIDPKTNELIEFGQLKISSSRHVTDTNRAVTRLMDLLIKQ